MDNEKNKALVERLQGALDAEQAFSRCFGHLSALVKDARVRGKFLIFVDKANKNKGALLEYLRSAGADDFVAEQKCRFCKVDPESFSLLGMINLGLEATDIAIRSYRELLGLSDDVHQKKLLSAFIKEKLEQSSFLRQEKRLFSEELENDLKFIDSFCIDQIIAQLWR